MTAVARTTYERATREYDDEHERALVDAIMHAVVEASKVDDLNCVVVRTGELASALMTVLATAIALSPAATRSPTQLRKTCDEITKRIRLRVSKAEADPGLREFKRRTFHQDNDAGGHA
jgi:hypothetical protein